MNDLTKEEASRVLVLIKDNIDFVKFQLKQLDDLSSENVGGFWDKELTELKALKMKIKKKSL